MIEICVVTDSGSIYRSQLGEFSQERQEAKGLEAIFGKELAFGGHPTTRAHLEWLQVGPEELQAILDVVQGLPRPAAHKVRSDMRWYGPHAAAALWAWASANLPLSRPKSEPYISAN